MKKEKDHKHSINGSRPVGGSPALAAMNVVKKKFCCECGIELDNDGKCQNSDDTDNFGKTPHCE